MGHAFQQTLMDALDPLPPHARLQHQLGGGHRPRRHRHRRSWSSASSRPKARPRHDLGREKFVERVWQWKQQSGSTITRQMRRLGASANWDYADTEGQKAGYFTMDAKMSRAVIEVFVRLYEEGLIYRGKRLVNWDPVLGTAVSDLEVDTEEEDGTIWEIRYPLEDGSGFDIMRRDDAARDDARRRRGGGAPGRFAIRNPWSASASGCRSPTAPSRSSPTTTSTPSSAPAR